MEGAATISNGGSRREHIVATLGICGGKPRIDGTRIKVQHVAVWHTRMALSPHEIVSQYPELSLGDVHAALAYYYDHRDEIEADLRDEREFVERLRGNQPSVVDHLKVPDARNDSLASG